MLRRTFTVAAVSAALVAMVAAAPAQAAPAGHGVDVTIVGISDLNGTTILPRPADVTPPVAPAPRARALTSHTDTGVTPFATGGGCSSGNNEPTCISWGTGQGLKSNFFITAWGPTQSGWSAHLYMEFCLSGSSCQLLFGYSATLSHTGAYPTFTVLPGSGTHGTAWTVVYFYNKSGTYQFATSSPNEYW
jgi:hypothetical protein